MDRYAVDELTVLPGESLAPRMHYHRALHWVVVGGTGLMTLDGTELLITENESVYLASGTPHGLRNPGKIPLRIIETQYGDVIADDIAADRLVLKSPRKAIWAGHPVELTAFEFTLIRVLAQRLGKPATYRELYDAIRGVGFEAGTEDYGHKGNVRSMIKRIRQKFQALDASFDQIENLRGIGYAWRPPQDRDAHLQAIAANVSTYLAGELRPA